MIGNTEFDLYRTGKFCHKIECEEGRDGSLSERRKKEDDRRSGVLDRRKGDRRKMGDRRVASFRHISSLI